MNNDELIKRIEALEKWKEDRERRQITYPLDFESIEALNKYFVRVVDEYDYTFDGGVGGATFQVKVFEALQDNNLMKISPAEIRYIANPDDNVITIINKIPTSQFADDQQVLLFTTDTAPGGLSAGDLTTYHVVESSTDMYSFKLSLSQGGAAVNITSKGTGRQIIEKV